MRSPFLLLLFLLSCACCPDAKAPLPPSDERAVAAMLDDWHDAAARADEGRYFGHIAKDGVFLGTDMTERWDKSAFLAYAHPRFASGKAWSFHAVERHVAFGPSCDVAWFDERLETERLGPVRGSGVVVRAPDGAWAIAHYDLSVPIPNEKFDEVKTLIAK
jgi:hypothetical protein